MSMNDIKNQIASDVMFNLLLVYEKIQGHCNGTHSEDKKYLGIWLKGQRQRKKKGKIDGFYEEQLEKIGVVWDLLSEK